MAGLDLLCYLLLETCYANRLIALRRDDLAAVADQIGDFFAALREHHASEP
jgi:hypothetical protein